MPSLGPDDGWKSAHIIAMLIVGCLFLVGFVFWESYWEHPLMPLHVWRDRNFSLVGVCCFRRHSTAFSPTIACLDSDSRHDVLRLVQLLARSLYAASQEL